MANLIIAIPFRPDPACDLDQMAKQFQEQHATSSMKELPENVEADIAEIRIVYQGDRYACAESDVVIAYGHGGDDNADLTNNQGQRVSSAAVMKMLEDIGAQKTKRLLFMGCYTAMEGHVAPSWKARHRQKTFGGLKDVATLFQGPLRSGKFTGVCKALVEV